MNSDVIYWQCAQFQKSKCKCKIMMIGADVYLGSTAHNHEETAETKKEILLMQLRSDLKTAAVDRPDEKPLHLITECVQKNNAQINEKECNRLRRVLNQQRKKVLKYIPKSKTESMELLQELMNADDKLVQSVDKDVAIVCRVEDLKLLDQDGLQLFADGTFKFSPRHFKQMYSFFVYKNGFYIPVLHVLLQDKKQKTYKTALSNIISLCSDQGIDLKEKLATEGSSIMIDFEIAMIKAIQSVFRSATIKGCKFSFRTELVAQN